MWLPSNEDLGHSLVNERREMRKVRWDKETMMHGRVGVSEIDVAPINPTFHPSRLTSIISAGRTLITVITRGRNTNSFCFIFMYLFYCCLYLNMYEYNIRQREPLKWLIRTYAMVRRCIVTQSGYFYLQLQVYVVQILWLNERVCGGLNPTNTSGWWANAFTTWLLPCPSCVWSTVFHIHTYFSGFTKVKKVLQTIISGLSLEFKVIGFP